MKKRLALLIVLILVLSVSSIVLASNREVNVMVETYKLDREIMAELRGLAISITYEFPEIDVVAMRVEEKNLPELLNLKGIKGVYRDNIVKVHGGAFPFNLDLIDVEKVHGDKPEDVDGTGIYVAVLDTGLLPIWKNYLPEERVATELGAAFRNPQEKINKGAWTGTEPHGTHVSSTIIGYYRYEQWVDGVAPGATIIPVKVLNNQGSGYDSAVAAGIIYVGNLKADGVITEPVVINMSLGGPEPNPAVEAAIDYAIDQGVVVVASAGNEGEAGMGWPGAYDQVISCGAVGWKGLWEADNGGEILTDLPEEDEVDLAELVYVTDFSSRELEGQYLDVLAPGDWIVGPYTAYGVAHPPEWSSTDQMGQYYYVSGTSMAAPHVSGTAALILEKNPFLTQSEVESILKDTATYIPPEDGVFVYGPNETYDLVYSWGTDATGSGLIQADEAVEEAATY